MRSQRHKGTKRYSAAPQLNKESIVMGTWGSWGMCGKVCAPRPPPTQQEAWSFSLRKSGSHASCRRDRANKII